MLYNTVIIRRRKKLVKRKIKIVHCRPLLRPSIIPPSTPLFHIISRKFFIPAVAWKIPFFPNILQLYKEIYNNYTRMGVFIMKKKLTAAVIAVVFGIAALAVSFSTVKEAGPSDAADAFCYILGDVRVSS